MLEAARGAGVAPARLRLDRRRDLRRDRRRSDAGDGPSAADGGLRAEQVLRRGLLGLYERLYGMSTLALRFGNVYGPRQDPHGEAGVVAIFCGLLRTAKRPKVYGTGEQTRDYIYVADVVEAIVAAVEGDATGAINLGTEEETSVLRIVELLAELEPGTDFEPRAARRPAGRDRPLVPRRVDARASCSAGRRGRAIAEGLRLTYASTAPVSAP